MKILRAEPLHHHRFDSMHIGFLDRLFVEDGQESPNFNRRMFDEDFAMIFSHVNRHSGKLFDIVSNDEELAERLLSNVKLRYEPHPTDERVREWVGEIAQSLIWFGVAFYWLDHDSKNNDIQITSFNSNGVVRVFGNQFQWIPKRTERHWGRDDEEFPREMRILDSAKVIRFVMPKPIRRMLSAQKRVFSVLDKHQLRVANLYPQVTHENPNPVNHFDFSVWRDTQEFALYRATRGTGWNGRKYGSSKRSDFFDCHRMIRFRRNQLVLRDDILSQISAQLSKVGKGDNAEFTIEISANDALPSIKQLDELEARLTREEVGFSEIIDYYFKC